MGLDPDLEEGLSQDFKQKLQSKRERQNNNRPHPLQESRYASKFAVPGSAEERQLLGSKVLGAGQSPEDWDDFLKFDE